MTDSDNRPADDTDDATPGHRDSGAASGTSTSERTAGMAEGYELGFPDLGLSEPLLRAVEESGYTTPTPIQRKAIPNVLLGNDLIGLAQTGTGKTAGFTLPMLDMLQVGRARARMPRSLILEPTRELAQQVANSFDRYGKYVKLSKALLIGGESMSDQERVLNRGVDVLIATPGRLIDLFERGNVILTDSRLLVIDEADRMLDMGFIPAIERICALLPRRRQSLMFSATMPKEIRGLTEKFLTQPKEVAVDPPASPAETVNQHLVQVRAAEKREALKAILGQPDIDSALVFCNRKRDVDSLQRHLKRHGYDAAALHGDMPQPQRMETLKQLDERQVRFLICSDVAARGLDLKGLSHVFNYDVPTHAEDYVHRIGRTGRAGQSGEAYTLATPEDGKYLAGIEKLLGKAIPEMVLEGIERVDIPREGERKTSGSRKRREPGGKPARRKGEGDGVSAQHTPGEAGASGGEPEAAASAEDTAKPGDGDGGVSTAKPARAKSSRGGRSRSKRDRAATDTAEPAAGIAGDNEPASEDGASAQGDKPRRRGGRRKASGAAAAKDSGSAAAADSSGTEAPQPDRRKRTASGDEPAESKPRKAARGRGGKKREREDDEPADEKALMIGSGEDIPAFLKYPARPRAMENS